jgi:aminoglycoside phosphotransferase (APT) family kinase protein
MLIERSSIDAELVRRLIAAQFPQWSGLPVRPVELDGWDNCTYRLGDQLTVRLPTATGYVPAVAKENEWLPRLAPGLPVPIPRVLAVGSPGEGYPFPWSVRGWLPGETADRAQIDDLTRFAVAVAEFLRALQKQDTNGGPLGGEHSWYRGAAPAYYDDETRRCLAALRERVDTDRALAVWEAALAAEWRGDPVWFHGDVAAGNLLVVNGELSAVIDFGTCGVGDPACDLVLAWTMLSGASREAFREAVGHDDGAWARARGWALWKSLLVISETIDHQPEQAAANARVLNAVIADHEQLG